VKGKVERLSTPKSSCREGNKLIAKRNTFGDLIGLRGTHGAQEKELAGRRKRRR